MMNDENYSDHNVKTDAVEDPVVIVSSEEMLQVSHEIKTGKAPVPSDMSVELIAASEEVRM